MVTVTEAVTPDFVVLTISPTLNLFWFKKTIPSVVVFGFSTTKATALLFKPVIFSPTIKSELLPLGPEYAVAVNDGKSASPLSFDSMTANNWQASATFNDIFLSWTLVPKTLLCVKPSFKLFVPIPEDFNVERFTINTFDSCYFFKFIFNFMLKTFWK